MKSRFDPVVGRARDRPLFLTFKKETQGNLPICESLTSVRVKPATLALVVCMLYSSGLYPPCTGWVTLLDLDPDMKLSLKDLLNFEEPLTQYGGVTEAAKQAAVPWKSVRLRRLRW